MLRTREAVVWAVAGAAGAASVKHWPLRWPTVETVAALWTGWIPVVVLIAALAAGVWLDRRGDSNCATNAASRDRRLAMVASALVGAALAVLLPPAVSNPADWQQAIGALIGFAALGGAALFNAYLTRKRDDRLNAEARQAIRNAIRWELAAILKDACDAERGLSELKQKHQRPAQAALVGFQINHPNVTMALLHRLDCLTPAETFEIADAYNKILFFNSTINRFDGREQNISDGIMEGFEKNLVTTRISLAKARNAIDAQNEHDPEDDAATREELTRVTR